MGHGMSSCLRLGPNMSSLRGIPVFGESSVNNSTGGLKFCGWILLAWDTAGQPALVWLYR